MLGNQLAKSDERQLGFGVDPAISSGKVNPTDGSPEIIDDISNEEAVDGARQFSPQWTYSR